MRRREKPSPGSRGIELPKGIQDYPDHVIARLEELYIQAYPGKELPRLDSELAAWVRIAYGVHTKEFLEVGRLRREMGFIP